MGSKTLLAGNALALVTTILAFLQALSWPIAGALIIILLVATLFLYVKQNMPLPEQEETLEGKPALRSSAKRSKSEDEESAPKPSHVKPAPSRSGPSKPSVPRSVPEYSTTSSRPKEEPGTHYISEGDYITFDLELDEGRELQAEVSTDGTVNAYIMTEENLTALDLDQEFWYEDGAEGVQKASLSFTTEEKGKWYLVVENDSRSDVTANVKISITKAAQPVPFLKAEGLELPDEKFAGKLA